MLRATMHKNLLRSYLLLFLIAALNAHAATQYWDTDGSTAGDSLVTGAGLGGNGNWSTAVNNWWDGSSGTLAGWTEGNNAVFWGTPGTVTLSGPRTVGNMAFQSPNYSVTASTLTLTGSGNISVASGMSATFNSAGPTLLGTTGYQISGGGTTIFNSTASTITGPVLITGNSTLEPASSACVGGTG